MEQWGKYCILDFKYGAKIRACLSSILIASL